MTKGPKQTHWEYSVFVIGAFTFLSLFRISVFGFRISPSLSSALNVSNQESFQIAISGRRISETGHYRS